MIQWLTPFPGVKGGKKRIEKPGFQTVKPRFCFLKKVSDGGIGNYMGTQQKSFQHHGGKKGDKWGWDWIRDLG